jgi:hypothetical protein
MADTAMGVSWMEPARLVAVITTVSVVWACSVWTQPQAARAATKVCNFDAGRWRRMKRDDMRELRKWWMAGEKSSSY